MAALDARRQLDLRLVVRSVESALECYPSATCVGNEDLDMSTRVDRSSPGNDGVPQQTIHPIDLTRSPPDPRLRSALAGVKAIVVATGTTAFPTTAWGPWFNITPDKVDRQGMEHILASLDTSTVERVVLVTSIGTCRQLVFPFSFLNLFGVLRAKRAAEKSLAAASRTSGFAYAIVRPGRLTGGPYTNRGEFQKSDSLEAQGVELEAGDTLLGEASRVAVGRLIADILTWDQATNLEFSVTNSTGNYPSEEESHRLLATL